MLVFTSVIVTVTPGSARPDSSTMLPSRPPFTAWAPAMAAPSTTKATAIALTPSARLTRRLMNPPSTYRSCNEKIAARAARLPLRATRRGQFLDPDIAIGDLVAVVLQQDVALQLRPPAGLVLELALGFRRHQRRAAQLVFDQLHAVEPVLDVIAVDENPAGVDFSGRFQRLVGGRGDRVVECTGGAMRADLRVGVPRVVDHLILVRD